MVLSRASGRPLRSPSSREQIERIVTMTDYSKLRSCELFLFDMDGTLYLGDNVYPGAIGLMEGLPALGKKYIYLTNNSSRAWASPARRKTCSPPAWPPECT